MTACLRCGGETSEWTRMDWATSRATWLTHRCKECEFGWEMSDDGKHTMSYFGRLIPLTDVPPWCLAVFSWEKA